MSLFNPFDIENNSDNNVRPFTSGFKEQRSSIATLVLYTVDPDVTSVPVDDISDFDEENNRQVVSALRPIIDPVNYRVTEPSYVKDNIPVLNGDINGEYLGIFNNFSLLQVMEAKDQIVKLHQNFGNSWNLFFFGDTPNVYTFRGIFLDTWDYPYYQEFMTMYEKYLSGRKCVENGFKMKISYDGKIIGGYLMNIQTVLSGDTPHSKTFSFTVIITDENFMRDNAVVKNYRFTGESGFNRMNNYHRVIRQYPNLQLGGRQDVEG